MPSHKRKRDMTQSEDVGVGAGAGAGADADAGTGSLVARRRAQPLLQLSDHNSMSADVPAGSTFAWAAGGAAGEAAAFRDFVFNARERVPDAVMLAAQRAAVVATRASGGFARLPRGEQAVILGITVGVARKALIVAAMTVVERARLSALEAAHGSFFPSTQRAYWAAFTRLKDARYVVWALDKCALKCRFAAFAKGYADLYDAWTAALRDHVFFSSAPLAGGAPCAGSGVKSSCLGLLARHQQRCLLDVSTEQRLVAEGVGLVPLLALNLSSALDGRLAGSGTALVAKAFGVGCERAPHYNGANNYHNVGQRSVLVAVTLNLTRLALRARHEPLPLPRGLRLDDTFAHLAPRAFAVLVSTRSRGFFSLDAAQRLWPAYEKLEKAETPCKLWEAVDDAYAKHNAVAERYKELRVMKASRAAMLRDFESLGWGALDLDDAERYLKDSERGGASPHTHPHPRHTPDAPHAALIK